METLELLGSVMGLSLVSGINLYATVLTVGLGVHLGFIVLPPHLAALDTLGHPSVLAAAAVGYVLEFFSDKVPWVDSLWDTIHTFIRPVGAALIAIQAAGEVHPAAEIFVVLLGGGTAMISHSSKASLRLVVNHSPEPFTNIGLSVGEDAVAIAGAWMSLRHPLGMLATTTFLIVLFFLLAPRVFRILRVELAALGALLRRWGKRDAKADDPRMRFDPLPETYIEDVPVGVHSDPESFCIRCVSGKGVLPGRNFMGFLCLSGGRLQFVTRKYFQKRRLEIDLAFLDEIRWQPKLFLDQLIFRCSDRYQSFLLFKHPPHRAEHIAALLESVRRRSADSESTSAQHPAPE